MKNSWSRGTKGLRVLFLLLALVLGGLPGFSQEEAMAVRFEVRDLVVDSGQAGLAAWQVELAYDPAAVKIVGIEGGDTAPFGPDKPPFYDPKGMAGGRIVLANLTTNPALRTGPQKVARLHLRIQGAGTPRISARVVAAGTANGAKIQASATVTKPDAQTTGPARQDKKDLDKSDASQPTTKSSSP